MVDFLVFFLSEYPEFTYKLGKSGVSWSVILSLTTVIGCCIYLYNFKKTNDQRYKEETEYRTAMTETLNSISFRQAQILDGQIANTVQIEKINKRIKELEEKLGNV